MCRSCSVYGAPYGEVCTPNQLGTEAMEGYISYSVSELSGRGQRLEGYISKAYSASLYVQDR
jgi:hypothetical protein